MGYDFNSGVKFGNKRKAQQAHKQGVEDQEKKSQKSTNIEVGDFISELALAIRYREKTGVEEGEWIDEPERAFSDGHCFGTEVSVASQVKLQITVSLDTSNSMMSDYDNCIFEKAGPTFCAIDRMIRAAMESLSPGAISYAPFIFSVRSYKAPSSLLPHLNMCDVGGGFKLFPPKVIPLKVLEAAKEMGEWDGEIKPFVGKNGVRDSTYSDVPLRGFDTNFVELFEKIEEWENINGDPSAKRLDIVITDGRFERPEDVDKVSAIQERRNGNLTTLFLNFLPVKEWSDDSMPKRCLQIPVNVENLNAQIREAVMTAISEML